MQGSALHGLYDEYGESATSDLAGPCRAEGYYYCQKLDRKVHALQGTNIE